MNSFRGKAAVNADNSRLVSEKWANFSQRAVPITAVSRKRKESEKLDLCRPFRCDIPVVFYKLNTKYVTSSQNTTHPP